MWGEGAIWIRPRPRPPLCNKVTIWTRMLSIWAVPKITKQACTICLKDLWWTQIRDQEKQLWAAQTLPQHSSIKHLRRPRLLPNNSWPLRRCNNMQGGPSLKIWAVLKSCQPVCQPVALRGLDQSPKIRTKATRATSWEDLAISTLKGLSSKNMELINWVGLVRVHQSDQTRESTIASMARSKWGPSIIRGTSRIKWGSHKTKEVWWWCTINKMQHSLNRKPPRETCSILTKSRPLFRCNKILRKPTVG